VIHCEIDGRRRRAEYNGRKIGRLAVRLWAPDELDDLGAHESPSHSAMARRPANESEIRYAVMVIVPYFVIAGLDPANPSNASSRSMDARIKSGMTSNCEFDTN
jgi:hypothetical protein